MATTKPPAVPTAPIAPIVTPPPASNKRGADQITPSPGLVVAKPTVNGSTPVSDELKLLQEALARLEEKPTVNLHQWSTGYQARFLEFKLPDKKTDEILELTRHLLSSDNGKDGGYVDVMKRGATFKGGWEPWLQVVTAVELQRNYKDLVVERETGIWENTRNIVDLWIQRPEEWVAAIELKCRHKYTKAWNTARAIQHKVIIDMEKFDDEIAPGYKIMKPDGKQRLDLYMYSVTITDSPYDLLSAKKADKAQAWDDLVWGIEHEKDVNWCYIYRHKGLSAAEDFVRVKAQLDKGAKQDASPTNLYLIWHKRTFLGTDGAKVQRT